MPSLELLQNRWQEVFKKTSHKNLKYKIAMSGGEVLINRDFLPFIKWLTTNYGQHLHNIGITSNGTVSKSHYLKVFEFVNFITLSTHTESMDIDKFFDKAKALNKFAASHPGKFFMVNIMQEFWAVDKIKHMIDLCHENNIYYGISAIDHTRQTRKYPIFKIRHTVEERPDLSYSEQQVYEVQKAIQEHVKIYNLPQETYHNLTAFYDDGTEIKTFATRIKWLGQDNFKGWQCSSGIERFMIFPDSTIWNGECFNTMMGKLDDHSFELSTQPQICRFESCTNNPDDLMVHKQIYNNN